MIPRVSSPPDYQSVRTVFLDRDGVLNRKAPEGQYVARWDVFHPLPGIYEAVRLLNRAELPVYVVTNQRGVALGLYTADDVNTLHRRLERALGENGARIDGFFFCPHDKNVCRCRKPGPGLFEQARALHPEIDFTASLIIGDSLSDMEAGQQLGMQTIFIKGQAETQKAGAAKAEAMAGACAASLFEAVGWFLNQR